MGNETFYWDGLSLSKIQFILGCFEFQANNYLIMQLKTVAKVTICKTAETGCYRKATVAGHTCKNVRPFYFI